LASLSFREQLCPSHYSWVKGPGAIGIGARQVVPIPVDADYRMDMTCLRQELERALKEKRPVIAVVGNDACWSQIARDQVRLLQDDVGTRLRHTDYHVAAEGLGARGFLLNSVEQIGSVLEQAKQVAAGGQPVLINAILGSSSFREGSLSM